MSEPSVRPGPPVPPPDPPRYDPAPPPQYGSGVVTYGEVRLSSGAVARLRSPILVAVFTLITLGVYQIVWWYKVNSELADHGRALGRTDLGDDPARSTLALFPGAIVVVPAIWTTVTTFQRIQNAQRLHQRVPISGWLGLVLAIVFSPLLIAYMQSGLNSAWSAATPGRP
jgi:hypothetical protein